MDLHLYHLFLPLPLSFPSFPLSLWVLHTANEFTSIKINELCYTMETGASPLTAQIIIIISFAQSQATWR